MDTEELLTDQDIATLLKVQPSTVKRWRREKTGPKPIYLAATTVRYRRGDVDAWIAQRAAS